MKTPVARKLPSGSWQVRVTVNGETKSITRPTKREAEKEAAAIKIGAKTIVSSDLTVKEAIDAYIQSKSEMLSPSTIRGYRSMQKNRFKTMMYRKVADISDSQWRTALNKEKKTASNKYLKNMWYLISPIIEEATGRKVRMYIPDGVVLEENEKPFLNDKQVVVFIDAIKGKWVEIPALLGLSSLRRSEILAMTWNDIDLEKGCLRVRGAVVADESGAMVEKKENKTYTSRRTIPFILPSLREAVERQCPKDKSEKVYKGNPNQIYVAVNRICKQNRLPKVGVQGLRRSFASLAYHYDMTELAAMKTGGWKDLKVMRKYYTKISAEDMESEGQKFANHF